MPQNGLAAESAGVAHLNSAKGGQPPLAPRSFRQQTASVPALRVGISLESLQLSVSHFRALVFALFFCP